MAKDISKEVEDIYVSWAAGGFLMAKEWGVQNIEPLDALMATLEMRRFNPTKMLEHDEGRAYIARLGQAVTAKVQELETVDPQR